MIMSRHPDFFQLRYLLHASRENYDSQSTLYICTYQDSQWEEIAKQVLKAWQVIDHDLARFIPRQLWQGLSIEEVDSENLARKIYPNNFNFENLRQETKQDILNKLSQKPSNEAQWKILPIHKTTDNTYTAITDRVYLDAGNPDLDFPELRQAESIILVKNEDHPRQIEWIKPWTAQIALSIALSASNPSRYYGLINSLIDKLKDRITPEQKEKLCSSPWLLTIEGQPVAPNQVISIEPRLYNLAGEEIKEIFWNLFISNSSYMISDQSLNVKTPLVPHLIKVQSVNDLIIKLLNLDHPSQYEALILKLLKFAIDNHRLSNESKEALADSSKKWLKSGNQSLATRQVIILPMIDQEIMMNLVEETEYFIPEMLDFNNDPSLSSLFITLSSLFITNNDAICVLYIILSEFSSDQYYLGDLKLEKSQIDSLIKTLDQYHQLPGIKLLKALCNYTNFEDIRDAIFQPFKDNQRVINILNWISSNKEEKDADISETYNLYLQLIYRLESTNFITVLNQIKLLNHQGDWKSPNELCDGSHYPSVSSNYILDSRQQEILSKFLQGNQGSFNDQPRSPSSISNQPSQVKSSEENFRIIADYFEPWGGFISPEVIGGFLCFLSGKNIEIERLAIKYLGNRSFEQQVNKIKRNSSFTSFNSSEDIRRIEEQLKSRDFPQFNINVLPSNQNTQIVISLTGSGFEAPLLRNQGLPRRLISEYKVREEERAIQITLFEINVFEVKSSNIRSDLLNLLTDAIKFLAKKYLKHLTEQDINLFFEDLNTSQQLNIEIAQDKIKENLPSILEKLSVESPLVRQRLREIDDAQTTKIEQERNLRYVYDRSKKREINEALSSAKKRYLEALENLRKLITESNIADLILKSIRYVISSDGYYGYDTRSIPFELFQNSDDALIELEEMEGSQLDDELCKYIILYKENCIYVLHWGRYINDYANNQKWKNRGFGNDLYKMLVLNLSDKTRVEWGNQNTTGKFGLGFKSVYLLSKRPIVLSGDLCFSVTGSIFPEFITNLALLEKLRIIIRQYQPRNKRIGTLFYLEIDQNFITENKVCLNSVIQGFEEKAGYILIFSRKIKECLIENEGKKFNVLWKPQPVLNLVTVVTGSIGNRQVLCFKLGEPCRSLVIEIPNQLSRSQKHLISLPTFWVTAPIENTFGFNFLVNADFDVTTGRSSLDPKSKRNNDIAQQMGRVLGTCLSELFTKSYSQWELLASTLKIKEGSEYEFWKLLWETLGFEWLESSISNSDVEIVQSLLSGPDHGLAVLKDYEALPNGLYGSCQKLISPSHPNYQVMGALSKEEYFTSITTWPYFSENYVPQSLVHHSVWYNYQRLMRGIVPNIEPLNLQMVLEQEVDNHTVSPKLSKVLNETINKNFMEALERDYKSEYDAILDLLKQLRFQNQKGQYQNASELILANHQPSVEEELLGSFAPLEHLLHTDYTEIDFFLICRQQRQVTSPATIAQWIEKVPSDKQKGAIKYLLEGEHCQDVARVLEQRASPQSWVKQDQQANKALDHHRRGRELRSEVNQGSTSSHQGPISSQPNQPPDKILEQIWQWWNSNHQNKLRKYNQTLYGSKFQSFKEKLMLDEPYDREAWLTLIFLGATHRMGRVGYQQHRDFIRFCTDKNWWKTFAKPGSTPQEWMGVLDKYIDPQVQEMRWFYWMEKFSSIYQISKYLEEYRQSFLSIEKEPREFDLKDIITPRARFSLSGGGIDAPPQRLGIGVNFIVRELVRLEIIQLNNDNQEFIIPHCFLPKAKVRQVFTRLGCHDLEASDHQNSKKIFKFIKKHLKHPNNPDITFKKSFDIPFQIYSGVQDIESISVQADYE